MAGQAGAAGCRATARLAADEGHAAPLAGERRAERVVRGHATQLRLVVLLKLLEAHTIAVATPGRDRVQLLDQLLIRRRLRDLTARYARVRGAVEALPELLRDGANAVLWDGGWSGVGRRAALTEHTSSPSPSSSSDLKTRRSILRRVGLTTIRVPAVSTHGLRSCCNSSW